MPNYRRVFIPGGTWFFTVNLLERRTKLLTDNAAKLRHAIFWTKRRISFRIDALVILPDHLSAARDFAIVQPDRCQYHVVRMSIAVEQRQRIEPRGHN